jgi:hypothetical protein
MVRFCGVLKVFIGLLNGGSFVLCYVVLCAIVNCLLAMCFCAFGFIRIYCYVGFLFLLVQLFLFFCLLSLSGVVCFIFVYCVRNAQNGNVFAILGVHFFTFLALRKQSVA